MSDPDSAPTPPADATEGFALSPASLPRARRPRLLGEVVYREEGDEAIDAMLAEVLMQAHGCVRAFGDFQFAVSGSEEMEPVLRRMMFDPMLRDFPWQKTRLWLLNDLVRGPAAPARDSECLWPRSRALVDIFAEHSGIPKGQLHSIGESHADPRLSAASADSPTLRGKSAASEYERLLRETLGWRPKGHDRLDCVMTRLLPSGSVGALNAEDPARLVAAEHDEADGCRVGLTLSFINASRLLAVLATGNEVQSCLQQMDLKRTRSGESPANFDAARIRPLAGEVRWYVDRSACA